MRVNDRSAFVHKFWSGLFGLVLAASALLFVVAPIMGWWLPQDAASYGSKVDGLFYLILAITGLAYLGTEAVLVWAMWRFVGRPGHKSSYTHGNHKREMNWTDVSSGILTFINFARIM